MSIEFISVFTITLATAAMVTLLWNLNKHGENPMIWETSFHIAILFGILQNWVNSREIKAI